ncbi:flagellar biosynthesis protein FlgH [Cognatishimia sp. SS12]|uniref:flagellar biosynthesis protein FlgH n=1 Tax=Cognatishimia sp. SS12 TaxID=2979465 RepID=UPI00232CBA3D|nr:flagellar biosynthesis protein FlgH [Cognatishimia sp. SS12]MDC0739457.1 flagellar biosynthesis protein FlgH [Cognatishimia sp. SS12]
MKKLLLILLGPILLGPAGYFAGQMLAPEPPAPEPAAVKAHVTKEEILYKMPIGKFTVQVLQPHSILHLLMDIDVYIAGASNFERLNGASGRTRLRDATVSIISDMAESSLWLEPGEEVNIDQALLAEDIVRKLHLRFQSVRTGRINEFHAERSLRN